ncbi:MAG: tetratricopeptide repeat protein [Acidobacteria bacterium]|nr:tetratricopeptide repeat protein [Acidobacteriota bacterium]
MKKDNVMFAVIGLLLGLIIGFIGTNWMNRSALTAAPTAAGGGTDLSGGAGGQNLPLNHPPIGSNGGDAGAGGPGAMVPQVQAAIDKAKQNPQDYEAQMTAADLYYQIQRFEDAATFYEAASKLKPEAKEPLIKLGDAFFDSAETASENNDQATANTKFPIAEKWYTQALAKDPKDLNVRTDLGLTFFLREPKQIDKAIENYKQSLAIDPKHEVTLQNLAIAYKEKNDTTNYQKTLDQLKAVNPNNPIFTQAKQSVQP